MHAHLKGYYRCSKDQHMKLFCELSSRIGCIYITATSPPADQQAIRKQRGGLAVHSYTNRSIVMTRGPCTEHWPSIVSGQNTNQTICRTMKRLDHYVEGRDIYTVKCSILNIIQKDKRPIKSCPNSLLCTFTLN